jgi:replication factor C small subunit
MGRVIGFMEGDGHLSSTVHLSANNEQTLKKVHVDISKFIDVTYNCTNNGIDSKGLCSYYNNKSLKLFLEYLGTTIGNKTTTTRKVPSLSKYKLFFKGYLQGLYDSDGKTIKILADRKSVSPVLLTQSITNDNQIVFLEEIANYAKIHFNIELVTSIKQSHKSTFGGTNKDMHLYSGATSQVKLFLESIGHYYDKQNNSDVLGYLQYKTHQTKYRFLTFDDWKDKFYGHGTINDRIVSITDIVKETDVYDCCLEDTHWYITNGFMSHNCNYPNKIIPAIHSRCQGFHIAKIDQTEFTARVAEILLTEKIIPELDILDTYVKATFPDLRKCINMVQMNSQEGMLRSPVKGEMGQLDWKIEMIELFKAGKIQAARMLLCGKVRPEEMEEIYRFIYENLELFGKDSAKQDQAVLIVKQGLVDHTLVADAEINLAAVLIKLSRLEE